MKLKIEAVRVDGGTQSRVAIDPDTVAEVAADMKSGDVFPAVTVFYDGADHWLADGFQRREAALAAGLDEIECDVREGTQADAQWYSFGANKTHGKRRSNADKQRAVKLALLHPMGAGMSDRQVADHVGVDHKTVSAQREKMELTGEIPQSSNRTGRDGRTIDTSNIGRPPAAGAGLAEYCDELDLAGADTCVDEQPLVSPVADKPTPVTVVAASPIPVTLADTAPVDPVQAQVATRNLATLTAAVVDPPPTAPTRCAATVVSPVQPALTEATIGNSAAADEIPTAKQATPDLPTPVILDPEPAPTDPPTKRDCIAAKYTGDVEWYTPVLYVESAREVLGVIDTDPASNPVAQQVVKAAHWYGVDDDGLTKDWSGTVFLNPPYAFPAIARFIEKLCDAVRSGAVTAAILLTNNSTDTGWWHQAASTASAICFTRGRINFYKGDGQLSQPTNGQNFFYFGKDEDRFKSVFSKHGFVMRSL